MVTKLMKASINRNFICTVHLILYSVQLQ